MSFTVETDYPGGNACSISLESKGDTTQIAFAPDPHRGPETLWFRFKVLRTASTTSQTLELLLKHSCNMLGGHLPQNLRPVIRTAGGDWQRLGVPEIAETPDGCVLVSWKVAAPQTAMEVAVCFPYGEAELETLRNETGWHCDEIGVGQRSTPLLRTANDYGHLENERPGLYLISQQHAGETSGSWVLDGFLRRLAQLGENAPLAWAVPLSDPDGVRFGDYSKDQFPYDLNRAWNHPPMRHETLVMRGDVNRWSHRCRPALALDFHAPGACEGDGIYSYLSEEALNSSHYPRLHECIESVHAALTPQFAAPNFERVPRYGSRWETHRFVEFMHHEYDLPCLTFEVPYALCGDRAFTREEYQEAGTRICNAVLDSKLLNRNTSS